MRRTLTGSLLVLHGLAHAGAGTWASDRGPAWLVTLLWGTAMVGYVAAGFGALGVPLLRTRWRPIAAVATLGSVALLTLFGHLAFALGLVLDVAVLVIALQWGGPRPGAPPGARSALRHPIVVHGAQGAALVFVVYLAALVVVRPWHMRWGASDADVSARLPGDEVLPDGHYRMDHVVTVRAPARAVWPWVAQIGQDRAGFYSYQRLERFFGAHITNADRVHPEWQTRTVGETVRAVQPDYLGGRLGDYVGWRVALFEPGRALVLENWGSFVVRPIDANTTRLHIRLRGRGAPSVKGTLLAPIDVLVFEPAHFIMERKMLLGIKQRAEALRQCLGKGNRRHVRVAGEQW